LLITKIVATGGKTVLQRRIYWLRFWLFSARIGLPQYHNDFKRSGYVETIGQYNNYINEFP